MPGKIYLVYGPQTRIAAIKRQLFGKDAITRQIQRNTEPGEEYLGSIFTFTRPTIKKAELILAGREQREPITAVIQREISSKGGAYFKVPRSIREKNRTREMGGFINSLIGEMEIAYGGFNKDRRIDLANGLFDMIHNAKRHGNNGDPWKLIFVCHYKIENGFAIEVIDEGEVSMAFLSRFISLPEWVRGMINCFRPNYHGMNIGIYATQVHFGKKNLSAHELLDKDGNRVGTRIRLAVVD